MRVNFIDRIRVILTILVIAQHSALTYVAGGNWFLTLAPAEGATSFFLALLVAIGQTFVLGFFFLIAGYLTPISYDLRGWEDYTRERLLRLGLPVLVFALVIGPLTVAIAGGGLHFARVWLDGAGPISFAIGPMGYTLLLLAFSLFYVVWRRYLPIPEGRPRPIPRRRTWIAAAAGVGAGLLAFRFALRAAGGDAASPIGGLPLFVFLFVAGLVAERHGWLDRIRKRHVMPWLLAAAAAIAVLGAAMAIVGAHGATSLSESLSVPELLYAVCQPIIAWGAISGGLWYFSQRWSEPDRRWTYLARQTYGAFIIHPPVLVATALVLERVPLPIAVRFVVLAVAGTLISFALATGLRRFRFVRRIV